MDHLTCRGCGGNLSASDMDRRLAIITCGHCGAIFDLTRRGAPSAATGAAPAIAPPERAPAALPAKFEVVDDGHSMAVRWRWFTPAAFFLLFFAIAWNAFLVGWFTMTLGSGMDDGFALIALLFPMVHVAVGVSIAYFTLALFLNTTALTVDPHELRITHGPMPWRPAPRIPVADIEQLFVKRRVSQGKNGTSVRYELRAVTREHSDRALLKGLDELDQALWLEQSLEKRLGIRDRAVAGEFRDPMTQR